MHSSVYKAIHIHLQVFLFLDGVISPTSFMEQTSWADSIHNILWTYSLLVE